MASFALTTSALATFALYVTTIALATFTLVTLCAGVAASMKRWN